MVVQGQLASHLFEGEGLSKGLSPFTGAFRWGSVTRQSRHGHCTLTRCSWGIPLQPWQSRTQFIPRKCPCRNPSTSWAHNSHAQAWCSMWSLVTPHLLLPHSATSASQSGRSWRPLCMQWGRTLRLSSPPCYDGFSCRWLPSSEALALIAICRCPTSSTSTTWSMPSRYVTTTTPAAAPHLSGNPPTNLNPSTPSISGGAAESSPSNRDPGQRVANPSPIEQFTQAYTAAGHSLSSIRGNAPSTTDCKTNTPVNLCLSYHLRGGCYSNCHRSSTHRPLMAPEQRLMTTFVAQYLPPASTTSPTLSISTTNSSPRYNSHQKWLLIDGDMD